MANNVIENLVDRLERLPGIGRKSARRLAYHIVNLDAEESDRLVEAIRLAKTRVRRCPLCNNFAEEEFCPICGDERRDPSQLMILSNVRDIDIFEEANCYRGRYFILLADAMRPMEGIGYREIGGDILDQRLEDPQIREVILALSSYGEAELTASYLKDKIAAKGKRVSRISQGIPVGGVIEYFDRATIASAYEDRKILEISAQGAE